MRKTKEKQFLKMFLNLEKYLLKTRDKLCTLLKI